MIFKRKKKSALQIFLEREKYPVECVFELGGKNYFAFADLNNQPAGRTLAALPLFMQLKINCQYDFLQLFVTGMESVLSDPQKISIEKFVTLKNMIKDRLNWAFTPDLVYKYASVVYFDEHENPDTYDEAYNEKKIEFWKQNKGMQDFFLSEPITRLIPHLRAVSGSFPMYSSVILKAQSLQLEALLAMISTDKISHEENQNLQSAITNLRRLYSFDHYPLTNTSSSLTEKQST